MTDSHYVGIDIGGTKMEVIVVDSQFTLRGSARQPTITTSPEAFLTGLTGAVVKSLNEAGLDSHSVTALGVGIPGQVDQSQGEVRLAVNLGLDRFPLGEALSARFEAPAILENDVRAAALGTYHHMNSNGSLRSLAYLGIGTGISAGLIVDGKLYRGAHGMAGEIGHIVVEQDGLQCICGQRGCLETIAAGPAIVDHALRAGLPGVDESNAAEVVYSLAEKGDPQAQEIVNKVAHHLARAVQWLIMTYDVEKVVLGGGVTGAGPAFLATMLSELAEFRRHSRLATEMLPDSKVALSPADFNAGAWGAVRMAQQITKTHQ